MTLWSLPIEGRDFLRSADQPQCGLRHPAWLRRESLPSGDRTERSLHVLLFRRTRLSAGIGCAARSCASVAGDLGFWGEWEAEADDVSIVGGTTPLPTSIFTPYYYQYPSSCVGVQNTDPFVFGNCFVYSCCKQFRPRSGHLTGLAKLDRGSVVLFGSQLHGRFVLDTVFVVSHWTDYDVGTLELGRALPEACVDTVLRRLAASRTVCYEDAPDDDEFSAEGQDAAGMFRTNVPVTRARFHDRVRALERLKRVTLDLKRGEPRWLAIVGPRKVGKSSLIAEAALRFGSSKLRFVSFDVFDAMPVSFELFRRLAAKILDAALVGIPTQALRSLSLSMNRGASSLGLYTSIVPSELALRDHAAASTPAAISGTQQTPAYVSRKIDATDLKLPSAPVVCESMSDGSIEIRTAFKLGLLLGGMALTLAACRLETEPPQDSDAAVSPRPDAGPVSVAPNVYNAPLTPGEWDSLDLDGRKRFMRELVMPSMRPLFQGFDAEHFAAFSCRTCHGSGVSGSFAMPSAEVPALSKERLAMPPERDKPMLAFMRETVKPKLAELLGKPDSLKCSSCHQSVP